MEGVACGAKVVDSLFVPRSHGWHESPVNAIATSTTVCRGCCQPRTCPRNMHCAAAGVPVLRCSGPSWSREGRTARPASLASRRSRCGLQHDRLSWWSCRARLQHCLPPLQVLGCLVHSHTERFGESSRGGSGSGGSGGSVDGDAEDDDIVSSVERLAGGGVGGGLEQRQLRQRSSAPRPPRLPGIQWCASSLARCPCRRDPPLLDPPLQRCLLRV